jgi:putative aminopeptidase FrvX
MPDTQALSLIRKLVALPGPPGQEEHVRQFLKERLTQFGYHPQTDSKGNLVVTLPGDPQRPSVVVTAHMDEIALMITRIEEDGTLKVAPCGGIYPWKWGEAPIHVLTPHGPLPTILAFGSVHTEHEASAAQQARKGPLEWERVCLFTGLSATELEALGVRPGLRAVLAPSRRTITAFGDHIAAYFLDDRADLAVWLLALEALAQQPLPQIGSLTFLATTSEEVGGEGARFYLQRHPADICIALEIGPKTPEANFAINAQPTIWVRDSYAAMEAVDGQLLTACCQTLGQQPHWQYLSRGGSDASCCAANGLVARPVTLGLPVENSHGYEIMHCQAPDELLRLLLAYLRAVGED